MFTTLSLFWCWYMNVKRENKKWKTVSKPESGRVLHDSQNYATVSRSYAIDLIFQVSLEYRIPRYSIWYLAQINSHHFSKALPSIFHLIFATLSPPPYISFGSPHVLYLLCLHSQICSGLPKTILLAFYSVVGKRNQIKKIELLPDQSNRPALLPMPAHFQRKEPVWPGLRPVIPARPLARTLILPGHTAHTHASLPALHMLPTRFCRWPRPTPHALVRSRLFVSRTSLRLTVRPSFPARSFSLQQPFILPCAGARACCRFLLMCRSFLVRTRVPQFPSPCCIRCPCVPCSWSARCPTLSLRLISSNMGRYYRAQANHTRRNPRSPFLPSHSAKQRAQPVWPGSGPVIPATVFFCRTFW
jgi:hypothetical protein